MSQLTSDVRNDAIDHLLKTAAWTQPTNVCVALFSGDPEGAGSELTGGGYARVTNNTWDAAVDGESANTGEVAFPEATGDWTEATHFALFDATTAGNRLASGALTTAKTVTTGDTARFAAGALVVAIDA